MYPDTLSQHPAIILPDLIDKLTPEDKTPETNLLEQGLALLRGKLG